MIPVQNSNKSFTHNIEFVCGIKCGIEHRLHYYLIVKDRIYNILHGREFNAALLRIDPTFIISDSEYDTLFPFRSFNHFDLKIYSTLNIISKLKLSL